MSQPPTEPLASHHDRGAFDCGDERLNKFLKERALEEQNAQFSVCWVLPDPSSRNRIQGFYTLSSYAVWVGDLPAAVRRNLPRYPDVPAALLGRLAVDATYRGQDLGEYLVLDAMKKVLIHAATLGTAALIVDAQDMGLAQYYRNLGFIPFPSDPLRLFIPVATIAQCFSPA